MTEENTIFDIKNLDDVSGHCKSQVKQMNVRDDTKKLISLFDFKAKLTIDEIIVGLYRMYKLEKTRVWVSSTLYNLKRKDLISASSDGVYWLNK